MSYVLKASTKNDGIVYFMNVIMITEQIEYAEHFKTLSEANENIDKFKKLFYYEAPKIDIVKLN